MAEEENYTTLMPQKTDVLFGSDHARWPMDAMLDYRPGNDYTYREGYRRAGRLLTEWVADHGEADFLVFPICHAYRHFVELTLKRLIREGCRVVPREMTPAEAKLQGGSHNLQALWETFKAIEQADVAAIGDAPPIPPEDLAGIEAYIKQLHAVDSGSFTFRYPLTKDGAVSVGDIERINLARFTEYMERLCNYLEGIEAYYGHLNEAYNDMMSDYY
jgi:hypothetical protein